MTTHDVVIIGSGAAGGMAAWNLTRKGANVLILDAGSKFSRGSFWSHVKPWDARQRLAAGNTSSFLSGHARQHQTPPGQPYDLTRVWGRGGKTTSGVVSPCVIPISTYRGVARRPEILGRSGIVILPLITIA
jgi:choline dehydrogenase-like flavoprotein